MKFFRVGQRVKFARVLWGPLLATRFIGWEGVVATALFPSSSGSLHGVRFDSHDPGYLNCQPAELEPLYDGHEKTSWEKMKDIWQPNQETCDA